MLIRSQYEGHGQTTVMRLLSIQHVDYVQYFNGKSPPTRESYRHHAFVGSLRAGGGSSVMSSFEASCVNSFLSFSILRRL